MELLCPNPLLEGVGPINARRGERSKLHMSCEAVRFLSLFFYDCWSAIGSNRPCFFFVCFNYFFCLITTGVDVHRGSRCDEAA